MEDAWDAYEEVLARKTGAAQDSVVDEHPGAVRRIDSKPGKRAEFLRTLEFGAWMDAVREMMRRQRPDAYEEAAQPGEATDPLLAYVLEDSGGDLFGFPNSEETDLRIIVRAVLGVVEPESEVVLDYTELLAGGFYSHEDDLKELALRDLREEYVVSERLIVLTEGSTDAEVLRRTLNVRYPHLKDYISFPDFHGSNAEGGTGALVNLVKGFAGSGVPSRVVALFDNDAAGEDARKKLGKTTLPDNVKVLSLPPLDYAKSYPTVGPQGTAEVDINGRACSLELYFGRDVLEDDKGNLAPVEWSGRVQSLGRYQGTVVGKAALKRKYLDVLSQAVNSRDARLEHDWGPMDLVFTAIFRAFAGQRW